MCRAIEADVPSDDHVCAGSAAEECLRPGQPRREQVLHAGQPVSARRAPFADLLDRALALLGRRAGALGKDDGYLIVGQASRENPEGGQFGGRVWCLAVQEVVGQPIVNDVEAGVSSSFFNTSRGFMRALEATTHALSRLSGRPAWRHSMMARGCWHRQHRCGCRWSAAAHPAGAPPTTVAGGSGRVGSGADRSGTAAPRCCQPSPARSNTPRLRVVELWVAANGVARRRPMPPRGARGAAAPRVRSRPAAVRGC